MFMMSSGRLDECAVEKTIPIKLLQASDLPKRRKLTPVKAELPCTSA
jgi:hypothetical protein